MWELDPKEGWAWKIWCSWTVVLEKTLESPLDSKEIKPVNPKGNQPWIFTVMTDAEAPILWLPDVSNWLPGKEPDAGKDWRIEEEDDRGWDGWMASPIQWTWTWATSRRWWGAGKPGVLQSMGSQRVGQDLATKQQQQHTSGIKCMHQVKGSLRKTVTLKFQGTCVLLKSYC